VLDACRAQGVRRLVYVSTYNVVFVEQPIIDGHEDLVPYAPLDKYHDEYSRTKRIAEEMVLQANSSTAATATSSTKRRSSRSRRGSRSGSAAGEEGLVTCALRAAAIYGDGEARHFPRILRAVRWGLAGFCIGHRSNLCDWLYVDNLTHALLLAASSLATSGSQSPAAGQAYCISDDRPVNNFDFLRPFCEGLGYRGTFAVYLPTRPMFLLAWLLELLRLLLLAVLPLSVCRLFGYFQPPLTRAEVAKVGITHFFRMKKAREHFGYKPLVEPEEATRRCVEYYMPEWGTQQAKAKFNKQQEQAQNTR